MKIIVKEDELKKIGSNLVNYSDDINTEKNSIVSAFDGISNVWEGLDITTFKDTVNSEYIKKIETLSECLKIYGELLKEVPSYYEKSDQKLASKKISI